MKPAILLSIAIVLLSSLPLLAHRDAVEAQKNAGNPSGLVRLSDSSSANAVTPPVRAELVRFAAGSAKIGASVTALTTDSIRTVQGVEIPKGSRLIGRVTNIVNTAGISHVNLTFDRAELMSGQSIPIHLDSGANSCPLERPRRNNAPLLLGIFRIRVSYIPLLFLKTCPRRCPSKNCNWPPLKYLPQGGIPCRTRVKFLPAQSYTVTEENSLSLGIDLRIAAHGNQFHALPFHSLTSANGRCADSAPQLHRPRKSSPASQRSAERTWRIR